MSGLRMTSNRMSVSVAVPDVPPSADSPPKMSMLPPPSSRRTENWVVEVYWSTARVHRYQPQTPVGTITNRTSVSSASQ